MPLYYKIREIRGIEDVKASRLFEGLPGTQMETRRRPEALLHPSQRESIVFSQASTQEHVDSHSRGVNIYTDGSKLDSGGVGCAVVIYTETGVPISIKHRLHDSCTVFQAELFALDAAIQWTSEHALQDVTIFTDSLSSLHALQDRSSKHPLVVQIHRLLHQMRGRLDVHFVWVKAHVGIIGNEAADVAAKDAASSDAPTSYDFFPLSYVKHQIQQESMDAWQHAYASADTGS